MWAIGTCYGTAVCASWVATIVDGRYLRFLSRAIILLAIGYALQRLGTHGWARYLTNLSGMLLCQVVVFFGLGVPGWRLAKAQRCDSDATTATLARQFGIGDVVVVTTVIALLLAVSARYAAPGDPTVYWSILAVAWLVIPLVAALLAMAALRRRVLEGLSLLVTALLIGLATVIGLSYMDKTSTSATEPLQEFASLYGSMMGGLACSVVVFGLAGRLQAATGSSRDQVDSKTDANVSCAS